MLTETGLLQKKVSFTQHEGNLYFDIEEIREAFPHTKFPKEKIKKLPIGTFIKDTIQIKDVQEMTEFDLKILQTLNFNPQKK